MSRISPSRNSRLCFKTHVKQNLVRNKKYFQSPFIQKTTIILSNFTTFAAIVRESNYQIVLLTPTTLRLYFTSSAYSALYGTVCTLINSAAQSMFKITPIVADVPSGLDSLS